MGLQLRHLRLICTVARPLGRQSNDLEWGLGRVQRRKRESWLGGHDYGKDVLRRG